MGRHSNSFSSCHLLHKLQNCNSLYCCKRTPSCVTSRIPWTNPLHGFDPQPFSNINHRINILSILPVDCVCIQPLGHIDRMLRFLIQVHHRLHQEFQFISQTSSVIHLTRYYLNLYQCWHLLHLSSSKRLDTATKHCSHHCRSPSPRNEWPL